MKKSIILFQNKNIAIKRVKIKFDRKKPMKDDVEQETKHNLINNWDFTIQK